MITIFWKKNGDFKLILLILKMIFILRPNLEKPLSKELLLQNFLKKAINFRRCKYYTKNILKIKILNSIRDVNLILQKRTYFIWDAKKYE